MFADDATLTFPGDNSWSAMFRPPEPGRQPGRTHRGKDEIEAFLVRYVEHGLQMEVEDILVNGPPWNARAAAIVHDWVRRARRPRPLQQPGGDLRAHPLGTHPARGGLRGHRAQRRLRPPAGARPLAAPAPRQLSAGVGLTRSLGEFGADQPRRVRISARSPGRLSTARQRSTIGGVEQRGSGLAEARGRPGGRPPQQRVRRRGPGPARGGWRPGPARWPAGASRTRLTGCGRPDRTRGVVPTAWHGRRSRRPGR